MEGESVWTRVFKEEEARIDKRRAGLRDTDKCTCPHPANRVGLALSGGGIRSATFSLGLMRSLSEQRLIHGIDYLSTVSGGGYAGAFYCSLFVPDRLRGPAGLRPEAGGVRADAEEARSDDPLPTNRPEENPCCDVLGMKPGRDAIAQLRQGGHYLAPNGTSDALFAAVIAIRNWFAVAITMGMALLALFLFINFAVAVLDPLLERSAAYVAPFMVRNDRYGVWQLILVVLAFWPAACAWAYWFTRSSAVRLSRVARLFSVQSLIALLIFVLAILWPAKRPGWHELLLYGISILSILSFLIYAVAELWSFKREKRVPATNPVEALAQEDRVRNRLSRWLLRGVVTLMATAALAAFHWASREQIWNDKGIVRVGVDPRILGIAAVVTLVLILASRSVFGRSGGGFRPYRRKALLSPRALQMLSLLVGVVLLAAFVTFWAAMAGGASQWIEENTWVAWKNVGRVASWLPDLANAWILKPLGISFESPQSAAPLLLLVTLKVALIAYLIGNVDSLLNRSSFSTFYSGRLRSAYLGATNRNRHGPSGGKGKDAGPSAGGSVPLDQDDPNDEISLDAYYDPCVMAPIHLINVTINETTSRSSRVIQRDRKGKSMTVAPCGYLYPPRSPADPLELLPRGSAEELPLSSWMAISGAAFTTGAGHHTSLGTAILATLTNMRLGYWWNRSNQAPNWPLRGPKRLVQFYLLRELRASYLGTCHDRWYLSDGGHYENTGTYELIRRRIPFIITSDNGADPYYEFSDLVNLIRKARIDFGTEIEFLDDQELNFLFAESPLREVFGSLDEIRQSGKQAIRAAKESSTRIPKAGPYATLARIRYPELGEKGKDGYRERATGTLLLIKPRITGRELPDLVQYRDVNAAFPQQPTTNQFFDEAQWESYYRLGQLIGDMIFKKDRFPQETSRSRWNPWHLEPLPTVSPRRRTSQQRGDA